MTISPANFVLFTSIINSKKCILKWINNCQGKKGNNCQGKKGNNCQGKKGNNKLKDKFVMSTKIERKDTYCPNGERYVSPTATEGSLTNVVLQKCKS